MGHVDSRPFRLLKISPTFTALNQHLRTLFILAIFDAFLAIVSRILKEGFQWVLCEIIPCSNLNAKAIISL